MRRMLHQIEGRAGVRAMLAVGTALAAVIGSTPAGAASAVTALSRGLVVRCEPSLPVFCANVHVGCAGRSQVPTFSFDVRPVAGAAFLVPVIPGASGQMQRGPLNFDPANGSAIVALEPAPAYMRISQDGRFSLRQYARGGALMAYGRCAMRD